MALSSLMNGPTTSGENDGVVSDDALENFKAAAQDKINQCAAEITDYAKQELSSLNDEVASMWKGVIEESKKTLTEPVVAEYNLDRLSMKELAKIIKENIVGGSNCVAAMKAEHDGLKIVYLAYCHDKKLLPIEKNKYLRVRAKSLAVDVNALFGDNKCIIIK